MSYSDRETVQNTKKKKKKKKSNNRNRRQMSFVAEKRTCLVNGGRKGVGGGREGGGQGGERIHRDRIIESNSVLILYHLSVVCQILALDIVTGVTLTRIFICQLQSCLTSNSNLLDLFRLIHSAQSN